MSSAAAIPSISMSKQHLGAAPIDGKTPVHFLVGVVAGMSGLNASWATVVVIGFEALLIMLEEGRVGAAFEKRSAQSYGNQAVDTMVGIAGVYYGEHLKKKRGSSLMQDAMAQQPTKAPAPVSTQPDMNKLIEASNAGTEVAPLTEVSGVPWYR